MILDLNPLKEPEPITIQLEDYVFDLTYIELYEANKSATVSFEEDHKGYMEQVRVAYEAIINSKQKFKQFKDEELIDCPKPQTELKLTAWQAEVLWSNVIAFIDDLFKKK